MAQVKRLGFGLQALRLLAKENRFMTSSEIAEVLGCEPTALRKVMAQLAESKLLEVRQGRMGGYKLFRSPEQIPLSEVFEAVRDDEAEWQGMLDTLQDAAEGSKIQNVFGRILNDINTVVEKTLGTYTVADLLEE
ncbi:TrmB family transcriptional regulator [Paenibacillus yonginensis]|uniref:TrmB family transcriptional regulator n=2 Tax=Paenibacillus TaxID=44249 RepID=A0A1B1N067_9BACL|nr:MULTISPECIES: Rrf2 family transcriptional regulator [Paenibacillus]ANS74811.1 TrmB family transcriptional regulator [Paenibacillus yonginensis]GGA23525.1 hypothetical protein GCM10010917_05330 [Paenibacillus physcomitrellae]